MFGIGYATAEDRLFFIDVLRHAGDATLAQFAGGANVGMDQSVWASEPYNDYDLQNQVDWLQRLSPAVYDDAQNYVAGINAYIQKAESPLDALTMLPGEYAAIGQPAGPQPFSDDRPDPDRDAGRRDLRGRRRQPAEQRDPVSRTSRRGSGASTAPSPGLPVPPAAKPRRQGRDSARAAATPRASRRSRASTPTTIQRRRRRCTASRSRTRRCRRRARRRCGRSRFPTAARSSSRTTSFPAARAPCGHGRLAGTGPSAWAAFARRDRRRPRAALVPALDVQRAAGQRPEQRQRPSADGRGAAGRVLLARDPDGGGHPRPRRRCRGRGVPGREPVRGARDMDATTRGRRPRRARTSSTRSRCRSATRSAASRRSTPTTTCSGARACRWRR